MAEKRKIEVFTAGCTECEETVTMVKDLVCESCEVIFYNLSKVCESKECLEKVNAYGIKKVPAVVVDGKITDYSSSAPTIEDLRAAGVGVCG